MMSAPVLHEGGPVQPGEGGVGLPEGDAKRRAVRQMFDAIAGRYEMVNGIMSFGLDRYWRRRCLEELDLPTSSMVLDFACGTGDLCRQLVATGMRPVGLDLSSGMITKARTTAPLVLGDGLAAPFADRSFDGAVSGFALRNVVDLGQLFKELARLLRPAGRLSLLDLGEPANPALRTVHRLWAGRAVPIVGSLLSDAGAYRYLPKSLAYLPPTAVTVGLLEEAGFRAVQHVLLTRGAAQLFTATRDQT